MRPLRTSLSETIREHGPDLPLPGSGRTLQRWTAFADVAAQDLSLVKLFEGHCDAIAIMAGLGVPSAPVGTVWGTWCAEPPSACVTVTSLPDSDKLVLRGRKSWCSGAALLSHALVSAWNNEGEPCLARVDLRQSGVVSTDEGWHAVGMSHTDSVDVHFHDARAEAVGAQAPMWAAQASGTGRRASPGVGGEAPAASLK